MVVIPTLSLIIGGLGVIFAIRLLNATDSENLAQFAMSTSPYLTPEGPAPRERRRSSSAISSGLAEVTFGKDKFMVELSVENYTPDEVSIYCEDGKLFVVGKNEKKNHPKDTILKSFNRKFNIPDGMDGAGLKWELSKDKVLSITVPRKQSEKT
ncbi:alpha-crystallin B chain isoform X2 [Folsomia candida]|uniref:Alpha-crystallin B chain n=1 Tax=Folsomia candida TaxID=158441 RepID=A0A226DPY6_FOLCA|nr:alpha-crystallin B chain isoform X2 [Folsomia candida]OXA46731.1 Alpha-crystallin B chain [Folsomia candida]